MMINNYETGDINFERI